MFRQLACKVLPLCVYFLPKPPLPTRCVLPCRRSNFNFTSTKFFSFSPNSQFYSSFYSLRSKTPLIWAKFDFWCLKQARVRFLGFLARNGVYIASGLGLARFKRSRPSRSVAFWRASGLRCLRFLSFNNLATSGKRLGLNLKVYSFLQVSKGWTPDIRRSFPAIPLPVTKQARSPVYPYGYTTPFLPLSSCLQILASSLSSGVFSIKTLYFLPNSIFKFVTMSASYKIFLKGVFQPVLLY